MVTIFVLKRRLQFYVNICIVQKLFEMDLYQNVNERKRAETCTYL